MTDLVRDLFVHTVDILPQMSTGKETSDSLQRTGFRCFPQIHMSYYYYYYHFINDQGRCQ